MCIYNVVVLGSLGIIFTLTTTQPPHVNFLIQSVIVFAATTLTQCFIFVPKVLLPRTFSIALFVFYWSIIIVVMVMRRRRRLHVCNWFYEQPK